MRAVAVLVALARPLVLEAAPALPLPSVSGMTNLNSAGYHELLRRFMAAGTIGVVASSGHMLYRGQGPEIDTHGLVMRFNGAVTRGFQNDVGVGRDSDSSYDGTKELRCTWSHGWQEVVRARLICVGAD